MPLTRKAIKIIEILIIIIVILVVLLANILIYSYIKNKEEDVQKLSEINLIRVALESYIIENSYYPQFDNFVLLNSSNDGTQKLCYDGFKGYSDQCQKTILNPIPNMYYGEGNRYTYQATNKYQDYKLEFNLKTNFKHQNLEKGFNCATNLQIISQPCENI